MGSTVCKGRSALPVAVLPRACCGLTDGQPTDGFQLPGCQNSTCGNHYVRGLSRASVYGSALSLLITCTCDHVINLGTDDRFRCPNNKFNVRTILVFAYMTNVLPTLYCCSSMMAAVLRMGPAGTRALFMAAMTSSAQGA